MGLSVGVLFTIIALTGAILVFYNELDSVFNLPVTDTSQVDLAPDYNNALQTLCAYKFTLSPTTDSAPHES